MGRGAETAPTERRGTRSVRAGERENEECAPQKRQDVRWQDEEMGLRHRCCSRVIGVGACLHSSARLHSLTTVRYEFRVCTSFLTTVSE